MVSSGAIGIARNRTQDVIDHAKFRSPGCSGCRPEYPYAGMVDRIQKA